jgi:hypothetical protein
MSRATWSAFECAALAATLKNQAEQSRLFLYGYQRGKEFIAAVQAGKVKREDTYTETPWIMTMLLEGPSADFMLGRIYSSAEDSALKDVLKVNGELTDEKLRESIARSKFTNQNCVLLK